MDRDLLRHAGVSLDEAMRELESLLAAIEDGGPPQTTVLTRLRRYYQRYEELARDHARDPVAVERALAAIASLQDDLTELERKLRHAVSDSLSSMSPSPARASGSLTRDAAVPTRAPA